LLRLLLLLLPQLTQLQVLKIAREQVPADILHPPSIGPTQRLGLHWTKQAGHGWTERQGNARGTNASGKISNRFSPA
jgi:hypothetical protein